MLYLLGKKFISFVVLIESKVPVEGLKISGLFAELEAKKTELGIADWGISQATLEDVFMEVVESTESKDAEEDELVR